MLRVGVALMVFALALTAVAVAVTVSSRAESERAAAAESSPEPTVEPLKRSKPDVEPWVEKTREPVLESEREPASEPKASPAAREDWPMPTDKELADVDEPRSFDLPRGAIMALTIDALRIHDAPVFSSTSRSALENGVSHLPGTSFPWSGGAQRTVYLAAHRLGYEGTRSRLIFYRLNRLTEGDEVVLEDRDGRKYRYRVTESFVVDPGEDWVTGQVVGRDMVTLQTCTPIPTFDKRLIVRADRI